MVGKSNNDNIYSVTRGIALEAQEMGKAVVKMGTKEECISIASKLAKAGFIVTITSTKGNLIASDTTNVINDQKNPIYWKSGQVIFSTAAEVVVLLRILWRTGNCHFQFLDDSLYIFIFFIKRSLENVYSTMFIKICW